MGLTNRQKRFIDEYLISWNASDAARRAGYTGESNKIGSRLLTYVDIQTAIRARMEESAMKADENLRRLADQARFNLLDFMVEKTRSTYDRDGNEIGEEKYLELDFEKAKQRGHLLKSVSVTASGVRVEAYDAQEALQKIGKALGLFIDRSENTNKNETVNVLIYLPDNGRSSSD